MKYWYSCTQLIGTFDGNNSLKQQDLSLNRYHYSWENIHIPHWDWKSDSPLCEGNRHYLESHIIDPFP